MAPTTMPATLFCPAMNAWFWLVGIESQVATDVEGAIMAFGDSIMDCGHSSVNANRRWPDYLARRLAGPHRPVPYSVLNAGISGNEVLADWLQGGTCMLDRLQRDGLGLTGVRYAVVQAGINDIIHHESASSAAIIEGLARLAERIHDAGATVHGSTLMSCYGHAGYSPEREATKLAVNARICRGSRFDSVIDFDRALRDCVDAHSVGGRRHAGDHLHPNDAGLGKMAGNRRSDAVWSDDNGRRGIRVNMKRAKRRLARARIFRRVDQIPVVLI